MNKKYQELLGEALSGLEPNQPPAGFVDAVLGERRTPTVERKSRRWGMWALAAAAAMAVFFVTSRGRRAALNAPFEGALSAEVRETVSLGRRAVAVAEPRSVLAWRGSSKQVSVEQGPGNVFYRVDRGQPLEVVTAAGTVLVRGTSFRVEVEPMKQSSKLAGAALAGALTVVAVYEGRVQFSTPQGAVELAAGEAAAATPGTAPVRRDADTAVTRNELEPPTEHMAQAMTSEQWKERDANQRREISSLRARVKTLEGKQRPRGGLDEEGRPWFDPSEDKLKRFAEECRVRMDMPPAFSEPAFAVDKQRADTLELSAEERAAISAELGGFQSEIVATIRALYIEATGDAQGADSLTASAMNTEMFERGGAGELAQLRVRVSQERGGFAPPPTPAELRAASPLERHYRLLIAAGDEAEARVANVLGPERAREYRSPNGWGSHWESAGCPKQ